MSDPAQRQQLLQEGSEAADFIRTSIVQAASNERGAFGGCQPPGGAACCRQHRTCASCSLLRTAAGPTLPAQK